MSGLRISVAIPAHNPRPEVLERTLAGLRAQTLPRDQWELLVVDNRSSEPLEGRIDLAWHPNARVLREEELGLTPARLRAMREFAGVLLLLCDDDNVLAPDYLEEAVRLFREQPALGAAGGRNIPEYEVPAPEWLPQAGVALACRDLGDRPLLARWKGLAPEARTYPSCAPVGAGMILRREAVEQYGAQVAKDPRRRTLDRTGNSLASGGDNDIVMTVLEHDWDVGYFPQLRLAHLIAARRLEPGYLERLAHDCTRSWIAVLDAHGLRPWRPIPPWTVPLRAARAYLRLRAWSGPAQRIRWRSACGQLKGQADLYGT